MIKKALRFTQKEIDFFIKTPHKKIGNDLFVIRFKPEKTLKIGVILAKKTYKTAVERNKFKRILYDQIFGMVKKTGFYLISPIKSIKTTPKEEISLKIKDLLGKIN